MQISIYILVLAYFARIEALVSFWVFFVLIGIEVSVFDRLGVGVPVGHGGIEAVRSQSFGAMFCAGVCECLLGEGTSGTCLQEGHGERRRSR